MMLSHLLVQHLFGGLVNCSEFVLTQHWQQAQHCTQDIIALLVCEGGIYS